MADADPPAYVVDPAVTWAAETKAYEPEPDDPPFRPLRIFTLDAAASRRDGAVAIVQVPYEPVTAGAGTVPTHGCVFELDTHDAGIDHDYRALDLDDPVVLLKQGHDPSPSDPLFHQQMVYAVASITHASFRRALGRKPSWGFPPAGAQRAQRLVLRPYGAREANAWYDRDRRSVVFGYFDAPPTMRGRTPPGGLVFTSLSHDIIVHEVTHALLDGLRSRFLEPTHPDVPAFHEAFADLMAIFHRFSYADVVALAVGRARGEVRTAGLLADIASQFGQALGRDALRSPIEPSGDAPRQYDPTREAHELGSVLVSAVFDAFATVVDRKTRRYVRLATGGTGTLPAGEIPIELRELIAHEASDVARQFLEICIRAIDYCPPVDVRFGEFLRAVITADAQLVRDDHWHYREAWIDAFRVRGIYPPHVRFLTEDALLWQTPDITIPPIEALTFGNLHFDGDPARPASAQHLRQQAEALGEFLTRPEHVQNVGIARAGDPELQGDRVDPPVVHSVRTSRRTGPDGQVLFDLVAEISQVRHVVRDEHAFAFYGGATVIIGPDGRLRYLIAKSILNAQRLERQLAYIASPHGARLWELADGRSAPRRDLLRALHAVPARASVV